MATVWGPISYLFGWKAIPFALEDLDSNYATVSKYTRPLSAVVSTFVSILGEEAILAGGGWLCSVQGDESFRSVSYHNFCAVTFCHICSLPASAVGPVEHLVCSVFGRGSECEAVPSSLIGVWASSAAKVGA